MEVFSNLTDSMNLRTAATLSPSSGVASPGAPEWQLRDGAAPLSAPFCSPPPRYPTPLPTGSQDDGKVIHISRVQHQAVRVGLGEPVALPCLFLLHPSASLGPNEPPDPPRVKWSKVRSASGQREDVPILVAKDNVVKVVKAYEGRVSLPGYARDRYNGTLLLRAARASDAGLYRCEVVAGIDDEQDLLPLEVMGELGGLQGRVLPGGGCVSPAPDVSCVAPVSRAPCASLGHPTSYAQHAGLIGNAWDACEQHRSGELYVLCEL